VPKSSPANVDSSPAEKFFGLSARPFSLTPDLRFAYHSRSHTHALEQVTSALRRREGLIVVTGPIGTGKTMLCRSMLENFESRTFLSVILDPGLEVEDLLRQVLTDFGIMSGLDAPASGPLSEVTRHQFVKALQQFLASLIPLQAHAVIMIDEAQRLNARVLEEIRLLSNFETDQAKLLQIVLVGQPDLDDLLRQPEMRQLNQRVARRCELYPLSENEVGDYVERRLTVAASPDALTGDLSAHGASGATQLVQFSRDAIRVVARISGGIPRVVNTLCDRALEVAYERQIRTVDAPAVIVAAERLRLEIPDSLPLPGARRIPRVAAAAAVGIVAVAGITWWWSSGKGETSPPRAAATAATAPTSTTPSTADRSATPPEPRELSAGSAPSANAAPPAAPSPAAATAASPTGSGASAAAGADITGQFQIAVAAFRTESRAADVVAALTELKVPASVRPDTSGSGTWQRVIAGPFTTRAAAEAAQETLTRAGYADTRIAAVP
jgi:general secretion pathway protein A